jgi:hypothetical protein
VIGRRTRERRRTPYRLQNNPDCCPTASLAAFLNEVGSTPRGMCGLLRSNSSAMVRISKLPDFTVPHSDNVDQHSHPCPSPGSNDVASVDVFTGGPPRFNDDMTRMTGLNEENSGIRLYIFSLLLFYLSVILSSIWVSRYNVSS